MPPLLAKPSYCDPNSVSQFHTTSESYESPAPCMLRVVPPTCVIKGELEGAFCRPTLSTPLTVEAPVVNAALSPEALKNVCPAAAMLLKMLSVVVVGPPLQPQEQLKFFIVALAESMAFRMSLGL